MSHTYRQKRLWVPHPGPPGGGRNLDGREVYVIGNDSPLRRDPSEPQHVHTKRRRQTIKKAKVKSIERFPHAAGCRCQICSLPVTRVRRGKVVVIPPEWRGEVTHDQTRARRRREARLKRRDSWKHDRKKSADHVAPVDE